MSAGTSAPELDIESVHRHRHFRAEVAAGSALLGLIFILCVFVPIFSRYQTDALSSAPLLPPSGRHLFGTDNYGRDLFVRVWYGGRLDISAGIVIVGISMLIGATIGTYSGATSRRWLDNLLMRIVDGLIAFPFVILVLALVVIIGYGRTLGPIPAGVPAISLGAILVDWTVYARLARNESLLLSSREYVQAARLAGYSQWRIIRTQLLPGVSRTSATYAVSDFILIIVTIASLSFLGAGVQPPTPEWGAIMYEGRGFITTAWWITVIPGIVLALTGLGVALIADGLLAPNN